MSEEVTHEEVVSDEKVLVSKAKLDEYVAGVNILIEEVERLKEEARVKEELMEENSKPSLKLFEESFEKVISAVEVEDIDSDEEDDEEDEQSVSVSEIVAEGRIAVAD